MDEDGTTRAYRLLSFLQKEYAPTSREVMALTKLYNDMKADNLTDRLIEMSLVGALYDGLTNGNWFWNS